MVQAAMSNRQQLVGWAMAMEPQQRSSVLAMIGRLDDNQCATYALVPEESRLAELQSAAQGIVVFQASGLCLRVDCDLCVED